MSGRDWGLWEAVIPAEHYDDFLDWEREMLELAMVLLVAAKNRDYYGDHATGDELAARSRLIRQFPTIAD